MSKIRVNTAHEALDEFDDCSVMALALALETDYFTAHAALEDEGRNYRCGASVRQILNAAVGKGFYVAAMSKPEGSATDTVRSLMKWCAFDEGRYFIIVKDHIVTVNDGQVDYNMIIDHLDAEVIDLYQILTDEERKAHGLTAVVNGKEVA